jgi:uncharacterized protein (TIGR00297 family)
MGTTDSVGWSYGTVDIPGTVALLIAFTLLFVSARWARSGLGVRIEISRKYVHVAANLTGAALPYLMTRATLMAAAALFVPMLIAMAHRSLLPGVVDRERSVDGPVMALCAYGILLVCAPSEIAIAVPMCVAGLADGVAGLLGSRTGVPRMSGSHRSWIGTTGAFIAAFFIVSIAHSAASVWPLALTVGLVVAAVAASIEVASPSQLDNFTLPIGTFVALQIAADWQIADVLPRLGEFTASVAIAVLAVRRRWLTVPGAFALTVVALFSFWTIGWRGVFILAVFFVMSSLLTRFRPDRAIQDDAAHGRGVRQVFAIAAPPLTFSLVFWATGYNLWALAFVTAVAVACADTFATEIGRFSRREPILVTSLKRVPRGTSGGVSVLGTLASVGGAALICFTASVLGLIAPTMLGITITLGVIGALADSVLGATLQEHWACLDCGVVQETRPSCHHGARRIAGLPFLNNEAVNFLTVAVLGCCSAILGFYL